MTIITVSLSLTYSHTLQNNEHYSQQGVEHSKHTWTIAAYNIVLHTLAVCASELCRVLLVSYNRQNHQFWFYLIVIIHDQLHGVLDDWRIFISLQVIENQVKQLIKKSKIGEEERQ